MTLNAARLATFLIVLLASLVSGCAGTVVHMQEVAADRAPSGPPPGKAMVAQNLDSVQSKRLEYYAEWAGKPAAEKPRLAPGDGR